MISPRNRDTNPSDHDKSFILFFFFFQLSYSSFLEIIQICSGDQDPSFIQIFHIPKITLWSKMILRAPVIISVFQSVGKKKEKQCHDLSS